MNKIAFCTGIILDLRYRTCVSLKSRHADELYRAVDVVTRMVNDAGFRLKTIKADGEFKSIMDPVKDEMDITMVYASTSGHIPEAERNNRVLGERIRAAYHRLPFKAIPKLMTRVLVEEQNKKLLLQTPHFLAGTYGIPRAVAYFPDAK